MINMSESFKTIVSYTQGKIELIGLELNKTDNLQAYRSPFHIQVMLVDLITLVECCKSLPIFNHLEYVSKDEVLSTLCFIHDKFHRLADIYYEHIGEIVYKGESVCVIYELMSDISFETLLYLQTNHEEYVKEWNKL